MVNLNAVSETALLTLKARVIEAKKQSPVIHDAKGREILNKITKWPNMRLIYVGRLPTYIYAK